MGTDKRIKDIKDEMKRLDEEIKRINRDIAEAVSNENTIQETENKIRLLIEFLEKSYDDTIIKLKMIAGNDPELLKKLDVYNKIIGYVDPNKRKIQ